MRARVSPHRDRSAQVAWRLWATFCSDLGVLLDLSDTPPPDSIPILQIFAHRYRLGQLSPCGRAVRSRTVEDAIRGVGQAFTGVGAIDPRLNTFGALDVRLFPLFQAWKKVDTPPARVKPLPLQLVHGAFQMARLLPSPLAHASADCLAVAFYFLLRPGEYVGTPKSAADDLFRLQDLGLLWISNRRLDVLTCPLADLLAATFATLTFTSQKNGIRGETIGHGRSGHPLLCPVLRLASRAYHLRLHVATATTPLNAARADPTAPWQYVQPSHITAFLRSAVALSPDLGFTAKDVSARSTRSGGAMALLCVGIDGDRIRLTIGHWRSDEMYRYLHVQAQPVMNGVAAVMLRGGTFSFHPSCAGSCRRPALLITFGPMGAKADPRSAYGYEVNGTQ